MANINDNATRMEVFNENAPYLTIARIATNLYTEYIKAYKRKIGHQMALYCALSYVYWVGMTEGIRKERKRKKAR